MDSLELLLKLDPRLVKDYDDIGMTGLHWACRKGFDRIADCLIDQGADVVAEDIMQRTPESLALKYGHKNVLAVIYRSLSFKLATSAQRTLELKDADKSEKGCDKSQKGEGKTGKSSPDRTRVMDDEQNQLQKGEGKEKIGNKQILEVDQPQNILKNQTA